MKDEKIELNSSFFYDSSKNELQKNDETINLTKKEQEVILCLITHKNQYVSIEKLRSEVWEDRMINEADIRVCIKNIRTKTSKDFIKNQRGVGYKIERAS